MSRCSSFRLRTHPNAFFRNPSIVEQMQRVPPDPSSLTWAAVRQEQFYFRSP